jgi:hypothetical protein
MPIKKFFVVLLLLLCSCTAQPLTDYRFSLAQLPHNIHGGIRIHASIDLETLRTDSPTFGGLSGLAWTGNSLYAISDHGNLFHLGLRFNDDNQLQNVEKLGEWRLRNPQGQPWKNKQEADSEGLVVHYMPTPELLVSFERIPRILRYSLEGEYRGSLPLPAVLKESTAYHDGNKMLEAIAFHPQLGILTTPEYPLRSEAENSLVIYTRQGAHWRLERSPHKNSAVTALEVLDDGSVLILERAFNPLTLHLVITIRHFDPQRNITTSLAEFDNWQDWRPQNFEGLSCRGRYCFMVSDDNFSPMQKTILVYFEILPR